MSTALEINGVSFVSIKEASRLTSYSKDYVSRLAREKKIVATQVGRQWYIDPVSLKSFSLMASLEQEVRKQKLSLERKREQSVKRDAVAVRSSVSKKLKNRIAKAKVVASLVLLVGVSVGLVSNSFSVVTDMTARLLNTNFSKEALVLDSAPVNLVTEEVDHLAYPKAEPVAIYSTVADRPALDEVSEVSPIGSDDVSGILLFTKKTESVDADAVSVMFSDDVNVRFETESGGVVVFETVTGEEKEFPFVSIADISTGTSSTTIF